MADDFPRPLSPAEAAELRRRQRGRNIALLVVLLAVAALFYAIAIVKLKVGGHDAQHLVAAGLATVVAGMVGLAFASVPLYCMFCAATGYDGTPQIGPAGPSAQVDRTITIAMNADTSPQLPWAFAPELRSVTMKLGEEQLAFYDGKNLSDHTITGHALYNVTPDVVGRYFHKTECFCFTSQTLAAG